MREREGTRFEGAVVRPGRCRALPLVVLLAAGCGADAGVDQGVPPDLLPSADLRLPIDATAPPDEALPDLSSPDLSMPDLSMPDLSMPDLSMPDLSMPDLSMPDLSTPDLSTPDLSMPDVSTPDLSTPDLVMPPDLLMPDLLRPPGAKLRFRAPRQTVLNIDRLDAIGDLDKDGFADLVGRSGSKVVVAFTDADGEPRAPVSSASGLQGGISSLGLGDFDGDGKLDVVVTDNAFFNGTLMLLPGNGDGTFRAGTPVTVAGAGLGPLVVTDFDGDKKLDVVLRASSNNTSLAILPGKGDGTFAAPLVYDDKRLLALATGDMDKDGRRDVVLVGALNDLAVHAGKGGGMLSPAVVYPATGGVGKTLALADFDGDGWLDAAGEDNLGRAARVAPNDKKGGFLAATSLLPQMNGLAVVAQDFDNDGKADLAAIFDAIYDIVVLRSTGNFAFTTSARFQGIQGAVSLLVGDVNGDGFPDLATGGPSHLGVVLGNGNGSLRVPVVTPSGNNERLGSVAVGDIDGDKKLDVLAAGSATIQSFLGNGDGTFRFTASDAAKPLQVALADLDGDKRLDALAIGPVGDVSVRLGAGNGTFGAATHWNAPGGQSLVVADLDGNGAPDLVTAGSPCQVLLGNGKGGFAAAVPLGPNANYGGLTVADVDGDKKPDVISTIGWTYFGAGDGTFPKVRSLGNFGSSSPVSAADLDGDGDIDLVTGSIWLDVYLNDGAGNMVKGYGVGGTVYLTGIADLDGDGKLDLIAQRGDGSTTVHLGRGDGTFTIAGSWLPGYSAHGDFNGDGHIDLLSTQVGTGSLHVMLND